MSGGARDIGLLLHSFIHSYVHLGLLRRLLDIVHADQKLYLVFEFLDVDLKRYIETGNQNRNPITPSIVRVSCRCCCVAELPLRLPSYRRAVSAGPALIV